MSDDLSVPRSTDSGAWRPASAEGTAQQARRRPGAVLLVILADLLFWHQQVGLSLALFAAAVFVVATADTCASTR